MTSIHPDPTREEAAAIAAAIALLEDEQPPSAAPVSGWKLAMRYPELSLDEIREMMSAAH